jgi:hypothetical protein
LPEDGSKGFRGPHLGHLSQISAPANAVNVGVDGIREAADQFHQTRFRDDGDTDLGEFLNEVGSARTKGQLRQEPKRVQQRGVARRIFQTFLGSIKSRGGDVGSIDAGPNQADHVLPFPGSREPPEASMTHAPSTVRCRNAAK